MTAFTIAMCTHNHADRLVRTLADLHGLRLPRAPWELLIIDNGSKDSTAQVLAQHAWPAGWQVRAVYEPKLGLSNARNRAIAEARGEFIVFIDDDETPDADWLCAYERLVEAHAPDAFGGRIEVLFEGPRPPWLVDDLLGFLGQCDHGGQVMPLVSDETPFFGGNFGFRRSAAATVGNFDPGLGRQGKVNVGGEEVQFYERLLAAGFKVWWTPESVIHHRIQSEKLHRRYFLDLHYQAGHVAGKRVERPSRLPPPHLLRQVLQAYGRAIGRRLGAGANHSLRMEMNAAWFTGYLRGWTEAR